MNNKVWLAIAALLVVLGVWYFSTQTQKTQAPTSTPTVVQISPTQVETMKKEATPEEEGKMVTKEKKVNLTASGFNPQTITVKVATKVVWENKSGTTATVNSAVHPTHQVYPPLNLGSFEDGEVMSLAFDKPGTYKYHNHLNPSQVGTVVVE